MQSGRFYNEFKSRANPNPQVADDVNDVNLDGFRNMDYEAFGINPQDLAQQTPNFKFSSVDDTTSRIFDNQNIVPNQGLNQPPKPQSGVDIIEQLANLNRSMKGQPPLRPQEPNINPQQQSSLDSINKTGLNDELAKEAEVFTKRGFVNQNMASNIAGMTAGGGIGATLDRENPTRGFILGAVAGGLGTDVLTRALTPQNTKALAVEMLSSAPKGKSVSDVMSAINNIAKLAVGKNASYADKLDDLKNSIGDIYSKIKKPTKEQSDMLSFINGTREFVSLGYDKELAGISRVLSKGYQNDVSGKGLKHFITKHYGEGAEGELNAREVLDLYKTIVNGTRNETATSVSYIRTLDKFNPITKQNEPIRFEVFFGKNGNELDLISYYSNRNLDGGISSTNAINHHSGIPQKQDSVQATSVSTPISDKTIPPNHLNSTKMKGGYTTQVMTHNILAASLGAGLGSAYAPEDKRLAGAVAGAFGVMGLANVSSVFNAVRNIVRDTGIDNAIKAGVDKTIVKTANKFLSDEANKIWGDVTGGMLNELKLKFSNTLDESYEVARDKVTGTMSSYYNKMVDLSAVLSKISKEDNKALYDFFVNGAKIDTLKPELREFANNAREQIIKEFSYQVDSGLISKEVADEFGGNFLSRVYENEKLAHKFKEYFFGSNSFTVDKMYARGTTKTVDEATYNSLLKGDLFEGSKIATKGDKGFSQEGKWILEGQKYNSLGKKEYILRRDYTSAEREAMGEVTDVAKLLPQTLYKMTERRVNNEFLTQIFLYHQSAFLLIIF
ncbi:hypothetical protein [Campylobacter geochelonis]|uniref:Uncharacterized protein n=1 Tax=Campylobacter geochelonis TaxID=1780362 RepID=A0A128EET9_9BACT|nr:hypothetical protein [Campylobacter geochelonis]QKF72104.1 hypothetical protein CGEO_1838 [Campylobacter geochelonis]CZE46723.1 Uncharacterised protein [Campylobacter geochelonis]